MLEACTVRFELRADGQLCPVLSQRERWCLGDTGVAVNHRGQEAVRQTGADESLACVRQKLLHTVITLCSKLFFFICCIILHAFIIDLIIHSASPKGGRGILDVSPLSGISRLSV